MESTGTAEEDVGAPSVPEGEADAATPSAPRSLVLEEYKTRRSVSLSPEEVRELRRLQGKLDVRPSLDGGFDVTATSWIGNVRVGTLSLTIRPKVPIQRVLFLLAYTLDPRAWRDTDFDYEERVDLLEAIAPGFVAFVRRALTRRLLRGYRSRSASLQTVRGRIRFADQIRRRFGRFPPAEVSYDEFTVDVLENRILRTAIERLGRLRLRSKRLVRELRGLRARFEGVSRLDDPSGLTPPITYDRLNEHYRPALRLARLILDGSSIAQREGHLTSSSLLVNMNDVFENFAVVSLREALGLFRRSFPQGAAGRSLWLDRAGGFGLRPDLSWWRAGRPVFVGDVKYKDLDTGDARPPDLYQLLAYMEASGLQRGMLIYPARKDQSREVLIRNSEKRVRIEGWRLDRSPEELLERVGETADRIRSL